MSLIDESEGEGESEYMNSSNNAISAILMQYLTFHILAFAEATFIYLDNVTRAPNFVVPRLADHVLF